MLAKQIDGRSALLRTGVGGEHYGRKRCVRRRRWLRLAHGNQMFTCRAAGGASSGAIFGAFVHDVARQTPGSRCPSSTARRFASFLSTRLFRIHQRTPRAMMQAQPSNASAPNGGAMQNNPQEQIFAASRQAHRNNFTEMPSMLKAPEVRISGQPRHVTPC